MHQECPTDPRVRRTLLRMQISLGIRAALVTRFPIGVGDTFHRCFFHCHLATILIRVMTDELLGQLGPVRNQCHQLGPILQEGRNVGFWGHEGRPRHRILIAQNFLCLRPVKYEYMYVSMVSFLSHVCT